MKLKDYLIILEEYNPEAEIEFEMINQLGKKSFEIYYRGGPNNGNKKTCEVVRIYIGDQTDF